MKKLVILSSILLQAACTPYSERNADYSEALRQNAQAFNDYCEAKGLNQKDESNSSEK